MALSTADSFATFDDTTGILDVSPALTAVLLADTATLGLLGMSEALAIKHEWNEDTLNSFAVTGNEADALDATETTFVLTDNTKLRVGALLKDTAAGKTEIVQVTAIDSGGTDITVERNYGDPAGETHAAGAIEWAIIGQPTQQGDETIADISNTPSRVFNYVQNFKRTVKIADEMVLESQNGLYPGISNYFESQLQKRIMEMMVEYNQAVIHGEISAAPSDTVYGTFDGLRAVITASGGNKLTDASDLTEARVNELYRLCWDDGGDPNILLGNRQQITRFADFNQAKMRVAPSDRTAGTFVNKYLTDMGAELDLVTDRHMPKDEVALLDPSGRAQGGGGGINTAVLRGSALTVEPLARIGNARRGMVTGRWTVECKSATKAHGWHTNLNQPASFS